MSMKDTKFTYYSGRSPELVKTSYGTGNSTNSSTSSNSNSNNNNYCSLLTGPKSSPTLETGTAAIRPTVPDVQLEQSRMTSRRTRAGSSAGSCVSARLCWSDEVHQVHTLDQTFDGKFPVLARVERGYYSGTEQGLELNIGQVLQIYGARDETRIMLRSSEGQTFSVPFNFRLKVRPLQTTSDLTSCQDSAQQLSKVAEESVILPVTVQVDSNDTDSLPYSNSTRGSNSSGSSSSSSRSRNTNNNRCSSLVRSTFPDQSQLTIESIYQSKFLVASPIQDDWLDTSKLLVIPSELQPQFTVAERLHGADSDVWNDFCGMFARSARQLRISDVTGYDGVVYTSWISQQRSVPTSQTSHCQTVTETDRELNFDRYKLTPPQDTRHCHQQQQQQQQHSHHHHQQQHRAQIHHQSPVVKSPVVSSLASGRDVTTPVCQSLDCLNLVSSSAPFRRDVPAQSSCDSPCRKKNSNKTGSATGAAYCRRDELSMLPLKDLSKARHQQHQHVKFPSDVDGQSSRVAETTLVVPDLPNTSTSHFSCNNSSSGRSDVVTSRNDVTCEATSSNRDFAVQVSLPRPTAFCNSDLPPRSSSDPRHQTKNFPRMGKRCALPVGGGARKSSLGDVIGDTTAAAGLSGSMPCLSAGGSGDVVVTSSAGRPPAVTQSVVNLPAASSEMVAGSSTSDCELNHSDEGYYTKDSSVSMSSGEMSFVRPTKPTRSIEPVFF